MPLTLPALGSDGWAPALIAALQQLDKLGPSNSLFATTVLANGAVIIDASQGSVQRITLSANVTGSTIVNGTDGQVLVVQWVQDATGNRSYAWPLTCRFNGSAPTASTIPGNVDSIVFVRTGSVWAELSRSTITP